MEVCLFGDSILDNSIWLRDPRNRICAQMRQALHERWGDEARLAGDFTVDALRAEHMALRPNCHVKRYFSMHRRLYNLPAYRIVDRYDQVPRHDISILSIGGNDVLKYLWHVPPDDRDWPQAVGQIRRDMEIALRQLLTRSSHVVVILPFMPFYTRMIFKMLRIERQEMVRAASLLVRSVRRLRERIGPARVSVCSLLTRVNLREPENYGSTPIEPSSTNGDIICRLLVRHLAQVREGRSPGCSLEHRDLRDFVQRCVATTPDKSLAVFFSGYRGGRNMYILGVIVLSALASLFGWKPGCMCGDAAAQKL